MPVGARGSHRPNEVSVRQRRLAAASFADGTPITLSFAQKIGEIMKHVSDGDAVQTSYRFYM